MGVKGLISRFLGGQGTGGRKLGSRFFVRQPKVLSCCKPLGEILLYTGTHYCYAIQTVNLSAQNIKESIELLLRLLDGGLFSFLREF